MNHVFSISRSTSLNSFKQSNTVDVEPPLLVSPQNTPLGSGIGKSTATPQGNIVNVVRDFYWTHSKLVGSRKEVPRIILSEKRLKANALISQLKYAFGVSSAAVGEFVNNLPENIKSPLQTFGKKLAESQTGQATTDFVNRINEGLNIDDDNNVYKQNPFLSPYQNLYITEPTGWEFILPYFDNYNNAAANAFTEDMGGASGLSFLKEGVDLVTGFAQMASVLRAPTQVTFVEKAKFYNYPTEGEEFTFGFPLINTGSATFDDVVRNWELLFLLLYNNKPSRKNVSVIDPPVIYQVEIPGVKFLPFCYIQSIAVDFQGSRREIDFNLQLVDNINVDASTPNLQNGPVRPGEQLSENVVRFFNNQITNRSVSTIVPDAYNIKITVKSLLPETKNFMYTVLNKNNIVSARTLGAEAEGTLNPIVNPTGGP